MCERMERRGKKSHTRTELPSRKAGKETASSRKTFKSLLPHDRMVAEWNAKCSHTQSGTMTAWHCINRKRFHVAIAYRTCAIESEHFGPHKHTKMKNEHSRAHTHTHTRRESQKNKNVLDIAAEPTVAWKIKYSPAKSLVYHIMSCCCHCHTLTPARTTYSKWYTISVELRIILLKHQTFDTTNQTSALVDMDVCECVPLVLPNSLLLLLSYRFSCLFITFSFCASACVCVCERWSVSVRNTHTHARCRSHNISEYVVERHL